MAEVAPYSDYDSGTGICISNHAEANCLLHADRSRIEGGTIYVSAKPCLGCAKLIANSGLNRVVWRTTIPDSWAQESPAALLQSYL